MILNVVFEDFYEVLPQILQDINESDFVAIDGEFTGISSFDKLNYFDTPAERYRRHYEVKRQRREKTKTTFFSHQIDRRYMMVQVGLAMIRCTNPSENR